MTPETSAKIAQYRAKVLDNTLTLEDMKEAIALLRGDRVSAAHASEASRRKSARAAVPSANELLEELKGL